MVYVEAKISIAISVAITGLFLVTVPFSVKANILSGIFGTIEEVTELEIVSYTKTDSIFDVPVLNPAQHADPSRARGGGEVLVDDGVLVSTGPVGADKIATRRSSGEISVYVVREGDSLSQIAEMFGVTTNTILWANDIPRATAIQPGDSLVILPVPGVRHIVKQGDTVDSIAKKFKGDVEEIISYNQLESGTALVVGSTLVIPGGAMHVEPARPASNNRASGATGVASAGAGLSHPVPGAIKTQGIHGYNAVDFAGAIGTPIRAAAAGEVIVSRSSGWNGGYGSYIVIRHSNGVQTLYAHLSRNDVGVGAYVTAGQTIGAMGNTGRSTGPHLHFEVRGARNPF